MACPPALVLTRLAVVFTVLVLPLMENFAGTHKVAVLMRYTGEEK